MGPAARQAEGSVAEKQPAQPGEPAVIGQGLPVEGGESSRRACAASVGRRPGIRCRPDGRALAGEPQEQAGEWPVARRPDIGQRQRLGPSVTGSGRIDRRQLGAEGEDEVAVAPAHGR